MTYESVSKTQAELVKVTRSTTERKIMSTKTSIKRIALVAVASLGVGLLSSVAPASATETSALAIDVAPYRATTTVSLSFTPTGDHTDSSDQTVACITSVPASADANTVEVGDCFVSADGGYTDATAEAITLGRAGAVITPANGTVLTSDPRTRGTGINIGDSLVGGYEAPATLDGDYADADEVSATSTNDYFNKVGTYGVFVFLDLDSDGLFDTADSEIGINGTFVNGGTPTGITITPAATTGALAVAQNFYVYATDASGNYTLVNVSGEQIDITFTTLSGTVTGSASGTGAAITSADAVTAGKNYYKYIQTPATGAGTFKVTANFSGSLVPLATAATSGTITVLGGAVATKVSVVTSTGVTEAADTTHAAPAALTSSAATNTIALNPLSALSVTYKITGTPGTYVNVALAASGTLPTGVTAGTTPTLIGADGTALFTVAATAATGGTSGYTLTVPYSAGNLVYTANYDNATVQNATITIDKVSATKNKIQSSAAASNSFVVTVSDEYGNKYSNYNVYLKTDADQRNLSKSISATTNASGQATVSLTDASTSTTLLSDVVTFDVYAPASASDLSTLSTTIYYTNQLGALTLAGGSTATSEVIRYVPSDDVLSSGAGNTTDDVAAITISLTDKNGAAVTGNYAITFSSSTGALFGATETGTSANGETPAYGVSTISVLASETVYAFATKPGVHTITASVGALSATQTFTVKTNSAAGRNVTLVVPATGVSGVASTAVATVTDGYGNLINGADVVFVRTGGRLIGGASSQTVTTNLDGTASIDYTTDNEGSVTITVGLPVSAAQDDAIADSPVTGFAAASGSKSGKTDFTGSSTDNVTSATDAANEATDAANAATDAANAAAEAADAATAAAQDAQAAVAALATSVASLIAGIKAQITTLTNLVIKIQKKVRA